MLSRSRIKVSASLSYLQLRYSCAQACVSNCYCVLGSLGTIRLRIGIAYLLAWQHCIPERFVALPLPKLKVALRASVAPVQSGRGALLN